jgi:hypothetical protein
LPGWLLVALGAAGAISQEAQYARRYFQGEMLKRTFAQGRKRHG